MALSMLLSSGPALHGEDDTVIDAAARLKADQGGRQQQIMLDQQMDGMFFHGAGAEQARQSVLDRLLLEVSAVDEACALSERQRQKCEAAARLDVARAVEEIDAVRRRFQGRTIDLQNPAGQAEWQRFHQDALAVQAKLQDAGGAASLLERVIAGILDDTQRTAWSRESELRRQYHWRSVVDAGMVQLDVALGLTSEQHDAIVDLLMERPLRINRAKVWTQGNHFAPFVCKYALSRLDRPRLDALISERQRKTLGQFIDQGRGMTEHLKQQKMILE
jgi:hypothetical protein